MQDENGEREGHAIASTPLASPGNVGDEQHGQPPTLTRPGKQVTDGGASTLETRTGTTVAGRIASSRVGRSLLTGIAVALLLTCIEVVLLWFLNPFAWLGGTHARISALIALALHAPYVLLLFLVQLAIVSLVTFFLLEPLALSLYFRDLQRAHKRHSKEHIIYHPPEGILATPVVYYQHSRDKKKQAQNITIHDVAPKQDVPLLLIGAAGAGKTLALGLYLDAALQQQRSRLRGKEKIPLYLPLDLYNLFLRGQWPVEGSAALVAAGEQVTAEEKLPEHSREEAQALFLRFLASDNVRVLRHIRSYLPRWMNQGRLLILCDDLHALDASYRSVVTKALVELMLVTQNHFVLTCRTGHEQSLQELVALEQEGHLARAALHPLTPEQVRLCVEQQAEVGSLLAGYTAGQVMRALEESRLRYFCANPLMFAFFMCMLTTQQQALDTLPDTRGGLLQTYVSRAIQDTQAQPFWRGKAPSEEETLRFLGSLACVARLANDSSILPLSIASGTQRSRRQRSKRASLREIGDALHVALEEALPGEQLSSDSTVLLRFARDAALLEIDGPGMLRLRFRHDVLASYFAAQYLRALAADSSDGADFALESLLEQILAHPARWSEPLALWAGLVEAPAALAKRLMTLGEDNRERLLSALTLSLVCMGVGWEPAQAEKKQHIVLPNRIAQAMTVIVAHPAQREKLARLFRQCMTEGGLEIFRSLLFVLDIPGIEAFYRALHAPSVLDILFTHLVEIVDIPEYEAETRRVRGTLAQFGDAAAARAAELSWPAPGRSTRLRASAIHILGRTQSALAVDPLIRCLANTEPQLVEDAIQSLLTLGAELALPRLLQTLGPAPGIRLTGALRNAPEARRLLHMGALHTLARFFTEGGARNASLTAAQQEQVLEAIVALLGSTYAGEADMQQQALALLVKVGSKDDSFHGKTGSVEIPLRGDEERPSVSSLLARGLVATDEVFVGNAMRALQEIGPAATSALVEQLQAQTLPVARVRILKVLEQVGDQRALPAILRLVSGEAGAEQQQVGRTLLAYGSASIGGLVHLVLSSADESVAGHAARILEALGDEAVDPLSQALARIVPGRTQLLAQVLQKLRNPRAVPALIHLLKKAQTDPSLVIAVIRALAVFPQQQVVAPLIAMLADTHAQVYEEAIDALSFLHEVALPELLAELDVQEETAVTPRIRRAITAMFPFPGEQLVVALRHSSDEQARQILALLQEQGAEGAQALAHHLFDEHENVRTYAYTTLAGMPGAVVVPPLLEMLDRSDWFEVVAELLLMFSEAIPPLVNLLGEKERGEAAAVILLQYGPAALSNLIAGLDDTRDLARGRSQRIIVELVRNEPDLIFRVVRLFADSVPPRARAELLEVVTGELAEESIPALLDGLEDAHLLDDVSKAFVLLLHNARWQRLALDGLLHALRVDERRRGAETALIRIGGPVVQAVGELIADGDEAVAISAQRILREIGVPALPFIWDAHRDTKHSAFRKAALAVFQSMPTLVIKDELVALLSSEKARDVIMALGLLLERIHRETPLEADRQQMAPTLVAYVQAHADEYISLRIIALLLLVSGPTIVDHIIQAVYNRPDASKRLLHTLLLLGKEAEEALLEMLDEKTPPKAREEAAGLLSLLGEYPDVVEYASSLGRYGLAGDGTTIRQPEKLALSLRSLGGLLASGQWDIVALQSLGLANQYASAERSLYYVLLGWNYEQEILQLQAAQQSELEEHNAAIRELTERMTTNMASQQEQIATLKGELQQVRHEHGLRGDELERTRQEREDFRQHMERTRSEHDRLRQNYERVAQERDNLRSRLAESTAEKNALSTENEKLQGKIDALRQDLKRIQDSN